MNEFSHTNLGPQHTSAMALMMPPRVVKMDEIGVTLTFGHEYCLTVREEGVEWTHRADAKCGDELLCGLGFSEDEAVGALRNAAKGRVMIPPHPHLGFGTARMVRDAPWEGDWSEAAKQAEGLPRLDTRRLRGKK